MDRPDNSTRTAFQEATLRFEPPPGIFGGAKSLAAYCAFLGVSSLADLKQEQLRLDLGDHPRRTTS